MTRHRDSSHPRHTLFTLRSDSRGDAVFVALCILLGAGAGGLAAVLKRVIAGISHLAVDGLGSGDVPWRFLILPIAGVILAGCLQRYILHRNVDHGTDRINEALESRRCVMPWRVVWGTMAGASLTLGLGGSAGAEGPIAYTGAALGSRLGRRLHFTPAQMAAIVAIGAGAGIAGIFRAPVGGMMFALEILAINLGTLTVVGLAAACVAAGAVAYVIGGFTPDLVFAAPPAFALDLIPWALAMGLLCGLYSAYYSWVMNRLTARLEAIGRPWVKWLISGSALALMLFALPALYGEGYQTIARILAGEGREALAFGTRIAGMAGLPAAAGLLLLAGAVAVCKAPAAAVTNSGGGVAGDFAPTIFAGSIVGFFFATLATDLLGFDVAPAAIVFMAMGGVMAGTVRAPLMAMFLVAEMTGTFSLFLPLAITSLLSYLVVRLLTQKRRATR